MTAGTSFSDILTAASKGWCVKKGDEGFLSMALPVREVVDPLHELHLIAEDQEFRFIWDSAPGLCIAAAGQCQKLDLAGPRRFELAQRFSDATFARLNDVSPEAPDQARPRILFAFSFFEQESERLRTLGAPSAVQALLPRWQLTRQGSISWLRLNGVATDEAEARELAEQLWLMRERLCNKSAPWKSIGAINFSGLSADQKWQDCYKPGLSRGIDLVNSGILDKLVLAVRQSILLEDALDPLAMLLRLRKQQAGSCRFLWQRQQDDSFFGASPERLISLRSGFLRSDALAGTTCLNQDYDSLLRSEKDLREHELVVGSITNQLLGQGLLPRRPRKPQLARHGHLVHLHTPITADAQGKQPLHLADALHPTPAVAGLPRRDAMKWIRTLERFERGGYAAPMGWIDSVGNAEFRVAIRCGKLIGKKLELTAGAGLVRGSIAERELQEVGMKLSVLANQLDLQPNSSIKQVIT